MADINTQTTNILDKKKTTSALDTVGNVVMDSPNEDIKAPPNTLDEKYKAWEEGYNVGENFKQTLSGEIIGMMFGDPTGGLKYPEGTDNDRTFETDRLKLLNITDLHDELKYWNELGKNTWDIDEESQNMPVKEWFSRMIGKLGIGKDQQEESKHELLKGNNYIPPKP